MKPLDRLVLTVASLAVGAALTGALMQHVSYQSHVVRSVEQASVPHLRGGKSSSDRGSGRVELSPLTWG